MSLVLPSMAARIILFGATGYTGELTARAMVKAGSAPILAARSPERVQALADELGGLTTVVADVTDPASVRSLVEKGDVIVTTVGPFARLGEPAFQAALDAGAHYVDSTGEPSWIRRVFEADAEAKNAGIAALTAFGYDYVPGNLAAGLALEQAGADAVTVNVGYFFQGGFGASGGTLASLAGAMLTPGFEYRDGLIRTVRGAKAEHSFATQGGPRVGLSIGSSEHFAIPQIATSVTDVNAYLGWFGPRTAPARYGAAAVAGITKLPGAKTLLGAGLKRALPGSTGGPSTAERAKSQSVAVAEALAADGTQLSFVELNGPNGYDLTAEFLAFAGRTLATVGPADTGSLGPVKAFGLDALAAGCAAAGLKPIS